MNPDASTKNPSQSSARKAAMNGFPNDTLVRTLGGYEYGYDGSDDYVLPIQRITVGTYVLSRCERTGEIAFKRVTRVFSHLYENYDEQEVMSVHFIEHSAGQKGFFDNTALFATPNHPFWVQSKGWIAVCDLQSGDEFLTYDGSRVTCNGVSRTNYEREIFNLEIEDLHTYFIHGLGMWVHDQEPLPI